MDNKTVFVVTLKGEGEIKNHTHQLPDDVKRALMLVDDESTVEVLIRRAVPSLRDGLSEMLQKLENGGFIQNKANVRAGNMLKMVMPKMSVPSRKVDESIAEESDDLDFTSSKSTLPPPVQSGTQAETARIKAEQEAAARAQLVATRAKAEAEAKAREEAAAKAKQEAEAARIKAEQEAAAAKAQLIAARAKAEAEARAREEAAAKAKQEAEQARLKAEQEAAHARAEAEAARIKAEQNAARIKAEAEAKAKQEAEAAQRKAQEELAKAKAEAEAARRKVEEELAKARSEAEAARLKVAQEAARVKAELEAARAKAEAETQARAEAEAKAKREAEDARLKSEQEATLARAEAEAKARREAEEIRLKSEQEIARIKAEAEQQVRQATQEKVDAELALATKTREDAASARSMIATVLFFDVVGYTKQSVSKQIELKAQFNKLVSEFIKDIEENQRIILDTGDGAAIGFLQHPEDAIEVALKFRNAVSANKHSDYPELKVRIGIHLGPVNIVKDMNGQSNMVGDGINDAQRIMNFASPEHIFISRSYYDVVSRLSEKYAKLFQYRGVKNDKHGRQHQVYEATVAEAEDVAPNSGKPEDIGQMEGKQESAPFHIDLGQFNLNLQEQAAPPAQLPDAKSEEILDQTESIDLVQDAAKVAPQDNVAPEKIAQKTQQEIEAEAQALVQEKMRLEIEALRIKAEQEAAKEKAEKDAREMADEQAKAWNEAKLRAKTEAAAQAKVELDAQQSGKTPQAKVARPSANVRRKPLPLGKIASALFVLLLALIAALPYVWPMQGYVPQLEKKLSAQLQQPVHIAKMKATLLPLPRLELQDVSVGGAQELKAANAVLNFGVTALFSDVRPIRNLEINNLTLNADSFGQALSWLQAAGGDVHYPVARMVLKHAQISGEGLALPPVNGDADWDAPGHLGKAMLGSEDGKLNVELQSQQSRWQIALRIKESSLPWLPNILFDELNVKGEAGEGSADFTEVNGTLYGGWLAGSAHLNWQKGWQMQGRLNITALELQKALPQFGIEGELNGDSSFQMNGATLPQLANAPHLDGTFTVKKGLISKMDMVETAANRQGMAGGRTHFDALSGTLLTENNSQHFRQLKISSGAMSASGSVDVSPRGQLSGLLSVDLKMRAGSVPLAFSGTLAAPILRPAR